MVTSAALNPLARPALEALDARGVAVGTHRYGTAADLRHGDLLLDTDGTARLVLDTVTVCGSVHLTVQRTDVTGVRATPARMRLVDSQPVQYHR